jgi:Flp pilus assembly pilin Flp
MLSTSLAGLLVSAKFQFQRLVREQGGQDLVEYALLVGFTTLAAWAFFPADIIPSVSTIFLRVMNQLAAAPSAGS